MEDRVIVDFIPLSYYAISGLINFITAFAIAFVTFLKNPKAVVNRTFSIFCFAVAWWSFFYFLWLTSQDKGLAEFYMRTCMIGVIFIPTLFFHFIISLLGTRGLRVKNSKAINITNYLLSIVFTLTVYTPLYANGASRHLVFPYWLTPGPIFHVVLAHFILVLVYAFCLMYRALRQSQGAFKSQLLYIFIGTAIGYISGSTNYFSWYRIPIPPLLNVFVSFYVIFIGYSIVKHRLMDIRLLVLKSVAYSLTLGIIAGGYATAAYLLLGRFQGLVSQNVFNIFIIFVAIFGFVPLKRLIEKYTDKVFAKGRYNFEELLEKLGKLMSTKVVLKDLAMSTLDTLVREMRLTRAAFVIVKGPRVTEVEAIGYKSKSVSFWDKATKLVADKKGTIIADELAEDSKEKEILRRLNAEVLLPLVTEEDAVGIIALGEKRSGDMFTAQDIKLLEIIAPEAAIAVNNASLFREKEKRIEELNSLNKLALSLGSTLHLEELLEELIDEAIKVTGAETGSIMLLDEETQTLRVKAARGIPPEVYRRVKTKVGEGIAGWVAKTSEPTMIIDSEHENEYLQKCLRREEITSALSVPLKIRNKVTGVLSVSRKKKKEVFTEEALNLMTSYAAQAAEAIENARLFEKSERQFMETITTLSGAVEAKDPYTRGHSDAVTKYAVSIAKEMGLPSEEIRNIEIAGRLHDIGKIGIPEAILNKPGRLSKEEREIINQHPRISVDILKPAGSLKDIIPTILYHHERFDGKGYPTGLAGKAIPLGARILAAADSFNAMTTDRPYRPALSLGDTIRELKENAGTQFDPDGVEAMLKVLETSELKPEVKVDHRTRHVKPLSAVS